jgi:hypothetical protein
MDDRPAEDAVPGLIRSIAARSDAEARELVRALSRRCWPVGAGDRDEPVAREWLRRWSPRPAALAAPACSCPNGRCAVCN